MYEIRLIHFCARTSRVKCAPVRQKQAHTMLIASKSKPNPIMWFSDAIALCVVCIIDNILVVRWFGSTNAAHDMLNVECVVVCLLFVLCLDVSCVQQSVYLVVFLCDAYRRTSSTSCDARIYSFIPIKSHRERVQFHMFFLTNKFAFIASVCI